MSVFWLVRNENHPTAYWGHTREHAILNAEMLDPRFSQDELIGGAEWTCVRFETVKPSTP